MSKSLIRSILCLILIVSISLCLTACGDDILSNEKNGFSVASYASAGNSAATGDSSLSSAVDSSEALKPTFTVMLNADDEKYDVISENPVSVTQGDSVTFSLKMKNDYCVDRILRKGSAIDAEIINGDGGMTTVTVNNIRYSMTFAAECIIAAAYISYYPNGGYYINENTSADTPYAVGHALKSRLRPNTEIGTDRIVRDGYTLIGWNTAPDGSGEHTGLGSRVTAEKNKTLNLYAEWEKQLPSTDFEYCEDGGDVTIVRYKGKDKKVVVPEVIGGLNVGRVGCGAFTGDIETVVFPSTIKGIESGAFSNCSVKEIYFYDNVTDISDACLYNCPNFSTVHINAVLKPRYGKGNIYSEYNFADKYDILILNKDKKKLLVFGGSGAYISCDTNILENYLKEKASIDYLCINMAVNGWFNGAAQFEMMMTYLGEGDIFMHIPETSSQFSFMYDLSMTPGGDKFDYNRLRLYYCVESNYDLFSLVDYRHVENFLDGFNDYNAARADLEERSYTDYITRINLYGTICDNDLGYIDIRGNFALPQYARGDRVDIGEADIVPQYVTDEVARTTLKNYYKLMNEKGASVFFLPAPINKDSLELRLYHPEKLPQNMEYLYSGRPEGVTLDYDNLSEWIAAFNIAAKQYIDNEYCKVLLNLNQVLYLQNSFFDSDYHLCDEKATEYTELIANTLRIELQKRANV